MSPADAWRQSSAASMEPACRVFSFAKVGGDAERTPACQLIEADPIAALDSGRGIASGGGPRGWIVGGNQTEHRLRPLARISRLAAMISSLHAGRIADDRVIFGAARLQCGRGSGEIGPEATRFDD